MNADEPDRIPQDAIDGEVARRLAVLMAFDPEAIKKMAAELQAAWDSVRSALLDTSEFMGAGMTAAERAKRRDTLHREAAAALGRGDRKAHRRALADLRFLNKTETP